MITTAALKREKDNEKEGTRGGEKQKDKKCELLSPRLNPRLAYGETVNRGAFPLCSKIELRTKLSTSLSSPISHLSQSRAPENSSSGASERTCNSAGCFLPFFTSIVSVERGMTPPPHFRKSSSSRNKTKTLLFPIQVESQKKSFSLVRHQTQRTFRKSRRRHRRSRSSGPRDSMSLTIKLATQ